jgi:hypothetical protein
MGAKAGISGEWGWAGSLPLSLALAWLLVRTSAGRLGRRGIDVPRPDDPAILPGPSAWQRDAMTAKTPPVPETNPLLWKELATRAALRLDPDVRRAVAWIFVIFLGLAWLATQGRGFGMLYFAGFLYLAAAVISGSSLFALDKEGRRFDMLLSTPLENADIVRAKLAAGLISPEAVRAGVLLLVIVVAWTLRSGPLTPLLVTPVAVLSIVAAYFLSAAASLFSPNARSAFLLGSGSLFLLLFVSPVIAPPLAEWLHPFFVLRAIEQAVDGEKAVPGFWQPYLAFTAFHLAVIGATYVVLVRGLGRVTGRI